MGELVVNPQYWPSSRMERAIHIRCHSTIGTGGINRIYTSHLYIYLLNYNHHYTLPTTTISHRYPPPMTTTMSLLAPRAHRQFDNYNGSGFWISSAIFTGIFGLFFFIHLGLAIKYKRAFVIPLVLFVFLEALSHALKLASSWIYYGDSDAVGSVFTAWVVILMSAPFCASPSLHSSRPKT